MSPLFQVEFHFASGRTHRTWLPFMPVAGQILVYQGQRLTVASCDYQIDHHLFVCLFQEAADARSENSQPGRRGRSPRTEMSPVQTQPKLG